MPRYPHDIEAEIRLIPTEEGGRSSPVRSGYRSQFFYDGHDWDVVYTCECTEWVYPGQTVKAYLSFLSPKCHVGKLYPGKEFLLREGARVVGKGRVTQLLELEKSAKEMEAKNAKQV